MTGKNKVKTAAAVWVAFGIVKELISPSPWNTHDPNWTPPQIYTGTVPPQVYELRQQVGVSQIP